MPYTLRPVFVGWIALVAQLPLQLFLTVWAGGFFGGFASAFTGTQGFGPEIAIGAAAFVLIPCVILIVTKLNYANTEYTFFQDRLELEEGFFSRNKKTIQYRDVLEVTLRRGFLQRSCDLGTVYLGTLATGSGSGFRPFNALGFGNVSASGISIPNIRDPDAAYARIRELVADAKAALASR